MKMLDHFWVGFPVGAVLVFALVWWAGEIADLVEDFRG